MTPAVRVWAEPAPYSLISEVMRVGTEENPSGRRAIKPNEMLVYVLAEAENLESILRLGYFKRIGNAGLYDQPPPRGRDSRQLSDGVVLAFRLDHLQIQLPTDRSQGLALSGIAQARFLPDFSVYKSQQGIHEANRFRDFYQQGVLGYIDSSRIDYGQSVLATAHYRERLDQSTYAYAVNSHDAQYVGVMSWEESLLVAKGVFINAISRMKFSPSICVQILGHSTAKK